MMASPAKKIDDEPEIHEPPVKPEVVPDVGEAIEYVEPPPEELVCSICLQVLSDPTLTSCCGQHFCRECIDRVIVKGHVCPLCNEKEFQVFLDKATLRKVRELKVYCKMKSRGCGWVGALGALDRHLAVENGDCGFVKVECEFGVIGCIGKIFRKDLENHGREYMHKHLLLMSRWSLKTIDSFQEKSREQLVHFEEKSREQHIHYEAVLTQQVEQQRVHFEEMLAHQRTIMQAKHEEETAVYERKLSQLSSDFAEKVKQASLDSQQQQERFQEKFEKQRKMDHEQLKSEFQQELDLKDQEQKENVADLQSKFEWLIKENFAKADQKNEAVVKNSTSTEQLKELEEKNDQSMDTQSQQTSERAEKVEKQLLTFIPPPDFTMTDFAEHKDDGDEWYSPPFYSHLSGYKMCVCVYANGISSGKGTHVAVFVYLMRGEFDDHLKWPFRGNITIQLLNQRGEERHVVKTVHFNDTTPDDVVGRVVGRERAVGRGHPKFTPRSALGYDATINTEYLVNDCLKFRVSKVKLTHPL